MGFRLPEFVERRPIVYHVTHRRNLDRIRRTRTLLSAGRLLDLAGRPDLRTHHRRKQLEIQIDQEVIVIRDQDRLVLASLSLSEGVALPDYIAYLNRWVYFWPGTVQGPQSRAKGLSAATGEDMAILRAPIESLAKEAGNAPPHFASVNTGSARHHSGKPAERHLRMHRTAGLFREGPSEVIEVVFENQATLPANTEVAYSLGGPWKAL